MAIGLVQGNYGEQMTELKYLAGVNYALVKAAVAELAATDLTLNFGGMGLQQFRMALNRNNALITADVAILVPGDLTTYGGGDSVRTVRNGMASDVGVLDVLV